MSRLPRSDRVRKDPRYAVTEAERLYSTEWTLTPEEVLERRQLRNQVARVLTTLTPREERVLRMRFGFGLSTDHTLEEVATSLSGWYTITKERVRQIEAKALRKLQHPSRNRRLKPYLDAL